MCAYPSGDSDAQLALEAMSFLQKGSDCEVAFKKFLCNLYHPQVQHIKRSCVSLPVSSRPHFLQCTYGFVEQLCYRFNSRQISAHIP